MVNDTTNNINPAPHNHLNNANSNNVVNNNTGIASNSAPHNHLNNANLNNHANNNTGLASNTTANFMTSPSYLGYNNGGGLNMTPYSSPYATANTLTNPANFGVTSYNYGSPQPHMSMPIQTAPISCGVTPVVHNVSAHTFGAHPGCCVSPDCRLIREERDIMRRKYEDTYRELMMSNEKLTRYEDICHTNGLANMRNEHDKTHSREVHNLEQTKLHEFSDIIKKLQIENDLLKSRINNYSDNDKLVIANMTGMLTDKSKDLSDARWKINDALEIKRKCEMDLETMKFELDNIRSRYSADMREKDQRLAQMQRNFEDSLDLKATEWRDLMDKFLKMETDHHQIYEMNQRLVSETEQNKHRLATTINEVDCLKARRPHVHHEIHVPPHQMPYDNRSCDIRPYDTRPDNVRPCDDRHYDDRHYDDRHHGMKNKGAFHFIKKSQKNMQRRHDKQLMKLTLSTWVQKFRQMKGFSPKSRGGHGQDGDIAARLLRTIYDVRKCLIEEIWTIFLRSVDTAHTKKTNSVILFILNIRECEDSRWFLMKYMLGIHHKLRKLVKRFYPNFGKIQHHWLNQYKGFNRVKSTKYLKEVCNKPWKNEEFYDQKMPLQHEMRDNINKWIEETLVGVQEKYLQNQKEKNRDFLYLYRLLTIKYRAVYPLRGKSYTLNDDQNVFLEDKIFYALDIILEKTTQIAEI